MRYDSPSDFPLLGCAYCGGVHRAEAIETSTPSGRRSYIPGIVRCPAQDAEFGTPVDSFSES